MESKHPGFIDFIWALGEAFSKGLTSGPEAMFTYKFSFINPLKFVFCFLLQKYYELI